MRPESVSSRALSPNSLESLAPSGRYVSVQDFKFFKDKLNKLEERKKGQRKRNVVHLRFRFDGENDRK